MGLKKKSAGTIPRGNLVELNGGGTQVSCKGRQDSTAKMKATCLGEECPKNKLLGPPGWGLVIGLTTVCFKNTKLLQMQYRPRLDLGCNAKMMIRLQYFSYGTQYM